MSWVQIPHKAAHNCLDMWCFACASKSLSCISEDRLSAFSLIRSMRTAMWWGRLWIFWCPLLSSTAPFWGTTFCKIRRARARFVHRHACVHSCTSEYSYIQSGVILGPAPLFHALRVKSKCLTVNAYTLVGQSISESSHKFVSGWRIYRWELVYWVLCVLSLTVCCGYYTDIEVQVVGLIKIIIDPESIMTESTAVSTKITLLNIV